MGTASEQRHFGYVSSISGDLGETEPEHSLSQSVHDHLSMLLSASSQPQKTQELIDLTF